MASQKKNRKIYAVLVDAILTRLQKLGNKSKFFLIWLIRKGFSLAKHIVVISMVIIPWNIALHWLQNVFSS